MVSALIPATLAIAAALSAWSAQRDLQIPAWRTVTAFAGATGGTALWIGGAFAPIAALVIVCLLIAETDRRHQLVPDPLTCALLLLALVMPFYDAPQTQLIGAAALGATFLVIRQICTAWRQVEALGWGDVKLAVAMGALLGPIHGFAAIAIAGAATLVVVTVHARGSTATIAGAPFGIALAAATSVVALFRAMAL